MEKENCPNQCGLDEALDKAEELLKQASEATEAEAKALRERAHKVVSQARQALTAVYEDASSNSKVIAHKADNYVHSNPWQAVGIAALGGLLLGLLVNRK